MELEWLKHILTNAAAVFLILSAVCLVAVGFAGNHSGNSTVERDIPAKENTTSQPINPPTDNGVKVEEATNTTTTTVNTTVDNSAYIDAQDRTAIKNVNSGSSSSTGGVEIEGVTLWPEGTQVAKETPAENSQPAATPKKINGEYKLNANGCLDLGKENGGKTVKVEEV